MLATRSRDNRLLSTAWIDSQETKFDGEEIVSQLPPREGGVRRDRS
jgi:hypothetical protein